MADIRPLSELYEEIGEKWVDYKAAATLLRDSKSSVISNWIGEYQLQHPGVAFNKAEAAVKASVKHTNYVKQMVEAERLEDLYKVKMDTIKMRSGEWSSQEANERLKAKL